MGKPDSLDGSAAMRRGHRVLNECLHWSPPSRVPFQAAESFRAKSPHFKKTLVPRRRRCDPFYDRSRRKEQKENDQLRKSQTYYSAFRQAIESPENFIVFHEHHCRSHEQP